MRRNVCFCLRYPNATLVSVSEIRRGSIKGYPGCQGYFNFIIFPTVQFFTERRSCLRRKETFQNLSEFLFILLVLAFCYLQMLPKDVLLRNQDASNYKRLKVKKCWPYAENYDLP